MKVGKVVVFVTTFYHEHRKFTFGYPLQLSSKTVKEFETEID